MRRRARIAGGAGVVIAVVALSAAPASGDALYTLQRLVKLHLKPAPLVPTKAPALLADFDGTLSISPVRRRGAFAWRLVHYSPNGPDAIIAFSRGDEPSLKSALRDRRGSRYRVSNTRVRGRRAYLAIRKVDGHTEVIELLWVEDGAVVSMATGTPKKVTLKDLRFTAAGLDRLVGNYLGSYFAPGSSNTSLDAVLVATTHTITGVIEFGTDNCTYNGNPAAAHGSQVSPTFLPLQGNAFTTPLMFGWSGTATGAISSDAIEVHVTGTGAFPEAQCDLGDMSVTATRTSGA
jgi:hypothetical protein